MIPGLLLVFLAAAQSGSELRQVRIILTGDLHARSQATADFESPGTPRRRLGGWQNVARVVDSLRTDATLTLDCGDFAFGSPESESLQGRLSIELLGRLGCDAATLGARDFSGGLENVEMLALAATFPLLGDPMLDIVLHRRTPLFRPYVVKDVRGVRVAVVGVADPEVRLANRSEDIRGLAVGEPLEQLRLTLAAVRAESVDLTVVLGHINQEQGCVIADSCEDVALVFCSGDGSDIGSRMSGHGTPVVSAGRYGQRLAVVDLLLDRAGRQVIQTECRLVNVTEGPPPVRPGSGWLSELAWAEWWSVPMAHASRDYGIDGAGRLDLGMAVASAVREQCNVDVALIPLGSLEPGLEQGSITRYGAFGAVPFHEPLRVAALDDTGLAKLVGPELESGSEPAPAVAGADYFVVGDTTTWPRLCNAVRLRVRDRRPGRCRVVATEAWLERCGLDSGSRLLPLDLTECWLAALAEQDTLHPGQRPRLYSATPGLVQVEPGGLVNVNTATADLLCTLPGIGPVTAQRIIEYRQSVGRFRSADDLLQVRGIGPKKLERLRPLVTVQ